MLSFTDDSSRLARSISSPSPSSNAVAGEPPASVHDLVEALQQASRTPAKQRTAKVSGVIDAICRHAFDQGLDQDALRAVVQVASRKTELNQTSVTTLLKNLYPSQRVPADVVVTVVGALGQGKGKPPPATQNGLVKWLLIVREIIEDPTILSRLYRVLFGMLDMISIRTSLCHLLSLITRRKHVQPFRIQQLLELSRGLGNEPALQGLLRIYKDYYPDIILGRAATSRNSFPPRLDPEWQMRLFAVQEASTAANDSKLELHNGFRVLRKGPKRSKISAIPDVHTFHANETSVTLEEIDNVGDFVEKLDRIEPPGQMISFLTDPLLQKYVALRPSTKSSARVDLWLSTCLEEEYNAAKRGTPTSAYLSEILDGLLKHAEYTKTLLPLVSRFLREYLLLWDGISDVDAILGLLCYIPLQHFEEAHTAYFGPAEEAIAARNPHAYEKIVQFYTNILRQWMNQATPSQPPHETETHAALTSDDQKALNDLMTYLANMSISIVLSLPPGAGSALISSIISLYELVSSSSKPNSVPIMLPPMYLTYWLMQDTSTTILARICGVIGNYKSAFDKHPRPVRSYYPIEMTDTFNWCLRDVYHLLWVSRAFVVTEKKSVGLYCDPLLRDALNTYLSSIDHKYSIGMSLALSNNPSLCSLSAAAWRLLEEAEIQKQGLDRDHINWHKGPVSQLSLAALGRNRGVTVGWDDYKIHVLEYLAARGYGGIKDLMFATALDLKKVVASR